MIQKISRTCFVIIAVLAIQSCGEHQNSKSVELEIPESGKSGPSLFYVAAGKSPDWKLVVLANDLGEFAATFMMNGVTASLQTTLTKSANVQLEGADAGQPVVKSNEVLYTGKCLHRGVEKGLTLRIRSEKCTDATNNQFATFCTIDFDSQTFQGCGTYYQ